MEEEDARNSPHRGGSSEALQTGKDRKVVAVFPDDDHGGFQDMLFDNVNGHLSSVIQFNFKDGGGVQFDCERGEQASVCK